MGNGDKKNKSSYVKYILILVVVFILSGMVGAFFANALVDNKPDYNEDDKKGMLVAKDKATVMIMGVDERADDVGRSDTLMIATLDPDKNQAALLSVPRDTRVKIKGHGFDKINAAYAYGGRKLTQETIESLLNTHIDHYIKINVHGFTKIIDALGGIDIDVEKRMYYEDPWDDDGGLYIDLQPGMQHMDGKTAITYVRYRDEEGDIGRIKRQQNFMKAVMDKLVSPTIIPKLPAIVSAVSDSVETDMSVSEILSFLGTLQDAKDNGLKSEMLPGKPVYIEGISYWVPDISKTRQILANTLGIKINQSITTSIHEDNIEYEESIPDNAVEVTEKERIKREIAQEREERLQRLREEQEKSIKRFKSEIDEERPRTNSNREKVETREETPVEDNTTKQKEPVPQTPTRDVPAIDMNTTGKS
ncbi:LCP family protein [Megamonas funiformis]|uniref:LCP family glycopolymer transferase n=1 Tax=Megamonas funiformis TaxID=437897 RepID=UPI00142F522B|nr:LCP family protein [Megamonas funiformis]MBM6651288.1 LCP family protein [Megamonas funiformis]NJE27893.1 LytR family transcriptional regulator [Megamonas funiformis]